MTYSQMSTMDLTLLLTLSIYLFQLSMDEELLSLTTQNAIISGLDTSQLSHQFIMMVVIQQVKEEIAL
jgi:hypothetical protein